MKNVITYLKALWSWSRTDRVRTLAIDAVSLPSFCRVNMLKLVSVLVLILTLGVGKVWGETFTINKAAIPNLANNNYDKYKDVEKDFTVSNITFTGQDIAYNPKKFNSTALAAGQFILMKKTTGHIVNKNELSLLSLVITYYTNASGVVVTAGTTSGSLSSVTGNSDTETVTLNKDEGGTQSVSLTKMTYDLSGKKYVRINGNGTNALYIHTITITTVSGTSVTLSKADTENGSFVLSSSNTGTSEINSVSTAGGSGTVYVVGTPSSGYYVSNVTQSGASAAPTITEVSENVWSVVYGSSTTSTSTISVTFSPIWALKGEFDSWGDGYVMTGTGTVSVTRTLTANTRYEFKIYNKGTAYGNNGAIVHSISDWTFATDKNNCVLYTGPAGDYTFSINTSTKATSVMYPSVTHPNANYVYIKKGAGWSDARIYNWDSGSSSKMSDWAGSPILASCEICDETYYYGAAYFNKLKFRDGGSNESNNLDLERGKWLDETTHADSWSTFDKYTISYDKGTGTGGSMSSHTDLCPGSSQQLTANAFSKSGYNFSGWTANVDVKIGGSTVPAGTLITGTPIIENVQSNITLTAQWTATTYTITYNGVKPGAENTNPTSYTVEDLPINLVAATHGQWRFDGWTDDNAGNADITTIPAGTTGNQSFTAHWTQRYAVTWYEESTPTVTYFDPGATLQFPADPSAPASCSEKKFVGWMVGTITGETDDKPTFITAGEVNADAAYHAVWANFAGSAIAAVEDNTFTQSDVSRETYCGISNGLQSVGKYVQNQSIWNASQMTGVHVKIKVYHVSNDRADVLRISLINSSGEEVVGTDLTTSKLGNSSSSAGYSSNVTLTPTTAVTGYKVSLKTKNSSGTSVGKVTREVVPAYSKYSTSCCDNNVAAPSVTATATRNSITLSWANVTDATGYKVTINGGTHDVTTAACTYTESGLTSGTDYAWTVVATYNPANYCGAIPTKNTTTTLSVYGVTYNKNTTIGSGTVTMSPMPSDASTYVVGENVTAAAKPTTCTNSGYTFNGWNTEPDGTGTHVDAEGTIAMVEGGLTLYAEWVAKRAYYVDRMHGQGDQTIEIGGKTYHCYYGDGYHITPSPSDQKSGDACQAPHYRFVRWLTIGHINADGTQKDTGGAVAGGVQRGTVTDGETYYAIWEEEIE